jgi:hypothetical protein
MSASTVFCPLWQCGSPSPLRMASRTWLLAATVSKLGMNDWSDGFDRKPSRLIALEFRHTREASSFRETEQSSTLFPKGLEQIVHYSLPPNTVDLTTQKKKHCWFDVHFGETARFLGESFIYISFTNVKYEYRYTEWATLGNLSSGLFCPLELWAAQSIWAF